MNWLQKLTEIAEAPMLPRYTGSAESWLDIETNLGIELPKDFKELIRTYGAGRFADFFAPMNPFYDSKRPGARPYLEWVRARLTGLAAAQREFPEFHAPFPIFPAHPGLLPWGFTDNGDTLSWLTDPPNNSQKWPIICLDDKSSQNFDRFDFGLLEFLVRWLSNELQVPSVTPPDMFPLPQPVFRPYDF